jgi:hypothetical protein
LVLLPANSSFTENFAGHLEHLNAIIASFLD